MKPNLYIREVYKECIKKYYPTHDYFDNEYLNKEYLTVPKTHDHNFWYCADICWKNKLNEFNFTKTLFQRYIYNLELGEKEQLDIQNKLMEYGKKNVKDWNIQLSDYLKEWNIDKNVKNIYN